MIFDATWRKSTFFIAFCLLGILTLNFNAYGQKAPTNKPSPINKLMPGEWVIITEMDGQIFPSYVIASANIIPPESGIQELRNRNYMGDPMGLIGIKIGNTQKNSKVKIEVTCTGILESSEYECTLPDESKEYIIFPKIAWRFDDLRKVRQVKPVSLSVSVTINGATPVRKVETIRVRSVNDCVIRAPMKCNEVISGFPWVFAAYVNEDHPWIDRLLKEALDTGIVKSFDGYQSKDSGQVYRQIFAIWNVLQRRGIKYSNILQVAPHTERIVSQHVRLLDEAIVATQANCVDGSIIFASAIRKIGIDPYLIIVPGHMMVGFYLDAEHKKPIVLETTMLGATDIRKFPEYDALTALIGVKDRNKASAETFNAAVASGIENVVKNIQLVKEGKLDKKALIDIDISAMRRMQVNPISYESRREIGDNPQNTQKDGNRR